MSIGSEPATTGRDAIGPPGPATGSGGRPSRRSPVDRGLRTSGVAVLVTPLLWIAESTPLADRGALVAPWVEAPVVGLLALVGWIQAGRAHGRPGRGAGRRFAWFVAGYVVVALLLPPGAEDPDTATYVLAALAMTAPGVATTVLDGSSADRAVVRVLVALGFVPLAVLTGIVAGAVTLPLSLPVAVGAGLVAGHVTTYAPLAAAEQGVPRRLLVVLGGSWLAFGAALAWSATWSGFYCCG